MKDSNVYGHESIEFELNEIKANDPKITSMQLGYYDEDEIFLELFEALKSNDYITSLDLDSNELSTDAIRALTKLTNIRELYLSRGDLEPFESIQLLADCPHLVRLDMSNSCVTEEALEYFWRHTSCRWVSVSSHSVSKTVIEKVYAACQYNRQLDDLKVFNAQFHTQKKPELTREEFVAKAVEEYLARPKVTLDLGTCYTSCFDHGFGYSGFGSMVGSIASDPNSENAPKKMGLTK